MSPVGLLSLLSTSFLYLIVGVILAGAAWRWRKRSLGITCVLRKFRVDPDPNAEIAVDISGRASGIVGWILTLMHLEPDVHLLVNRNEVSIRSTSLRGFWHEFIPLRSIQSTSCGYDRSMLALIFAAIFGLAFVLNVFAAVTSSNQNEFGATMGVAFGSLILCAIAALVYYLSKRIVLSIHDGASKTRGVVFKRSVIENVTIDLPQALEAVAVINQRVLFHAAVGDRAPSPAVTSQTPGTICPQCATVNPAGIRFCENCGTQITVAEVARAGR
ncbi:MAG TPA: zinc ribbon domain-containing protein [Terriglobales bacterium]|nr:zinc ribbon domain-containing protein [Terriglobales bacterium]